MSELFEKKRTGEIIKTKRLELGLTQADFARKINVSISAVSKWETGRGMPDITLLYIIARELGVTIDYLLGGDETPSADIAIKAYKKRLLKRTIKILSVFALALVLVVSTTLGIHYNKEELFYGGSSNRACYNFAKEYLAAWNESNEAFAAYLGFGGENIDLFLMTKFIERKNSLGKLRFLKFTERKRDDYYRESMGTLGVLTSFEHDRSIVGMGLSDEELIEKDNSWQYKYSFPYAITPSDNCYEGIINMETQTVTIPTEKENYLKILDLQSFGINPESVVLYDEGNIVYHNIFPKMFIRIFSNDQNINSGFSFRYQELFVLLSIKSENLWFRLC